MCRKFSQILYGEKMELKYLPVKFFISIDKQKLKNSKKDIIDFAFILRSVLGYNLRSICCIAHGKECTICSYNKTCAYSFIFETIIAKDNQFSPGTNRASHPFTFTNCSVNSFTINLFGKACEYLPYIYAAFHRAGQKGIFKERIPFRIKDVKILDKSILIDEQSIDTDNQLLIWSFKNNDSFYKEIKEIFIELKTPLRFKVFGKYTKFFSSRDFMQCLYRRCKTLCFLYGAFEDVAHYNTSNITFEISEKNLVWKDTKHYSSRQNKVMELGGILGTFKLKGMFSRFDIALLDFARIFSAGKNTNFGLGQLDYWMK